MSLTSSYLAGNTVRMLITVNYVQARDCALRCYKTDMGSPVYMKAAFMSPDFFCELSKAPKDSDVLGNKFGCNIEGAKNFLKSMWFQASFIFRLRNQFVITYQLCILNVVIYYI